MFNNDLACHDFLKIFLCFNIYYAGVKTTVFNLRLLFNIYYLCDKLIL
jgi:hypothetical protein